MSKPETGQGSNLRSRPSDPASRTAPCFSLLEQALRRAATVVAEEAALELPENLVQIEADPVPLPPARFAALSQQLEESVKALSDTKRRRLLIRLSPALADLEKAIAALTEYRDEMEQKLGRTTGHRSEVAAYDRSRLATRR